MKKSSNLWLILVGLLALLLILNLLAPPGSNQRLGSSFSRQPDGYGAWFAYMQEQGHEVQRLQQPYDQLPTDQETTLIQVHHPYRPSLSESEQAWVEAGNTLVILGEGAPVTEANFRSTHSTPFGSVLIETTRRHPRTRREPLLQDEFGRITWSESEGEGQVIYVVTPFLAANAYQDQAGNFPLLESWVTAAGGPIWIDEYIHGYRDPEQVENVARTWTEFFGNSAMLPVVIQAGVILGIGIVAANRRFGQALVPPGEARTNSETYIQALAAVLQKANSREFVVETLGKAERIQLQRALGLGQQRISTPNLLKAWTERTGRPAADLEALLQYLPATEGSAMTRSRPRRLTDAELIQWLQTIQQVRQVASGSRAPHLDPNLSNGESKG